MFPRQFDQAMTEPWQVRNATGHSDRSRRHLVSAQAYRGYEIHVRRPSTSPVVECVQTGHADHLVRLPKESLREFSNVVPDSARRCEFRFRSNSKNALRREII